MVINLDLSVKYNGGLLPDIILLTQGYYHRGTRLNTMFQRPCLYSLSMKQYIITIFSTCPLHTISGRGKI